MKVVDFKVPQTSRQAFRVQVDALPYFYDKLHQHKEAQIMLIEDGQGTLVAGDYVGRFKSGELYVLGSNQPHVFRSDPAYYEPTNGLSVRSLSIYFNESYLGDDFWSLEEMGDARELLFHAKRGLSVTGQTQAHVVEEMHQLTHSSGIQKLQSFFTILNLLIESTDISPLSVAAPTDSYSHHEGKRMNEVLQFTFQQSHRKIYVEEVARMANLSVEAFCRYFKLRTGKTYTSFLNEVRISNACKLLIEAELSVQDICFQVGFNNLSNFNRIFKKVTGKKPSQYLRT